MSHFKGRVIVYSIIGCPHCIRAKNQLQDKSIPYTDISLDTYPHLREELRKMTGTSVVPQIYFNNVRVGGSSELDSLMENKEEFNKMIEEIKNNVPSQGFPDIPDASTAVTEASQFICEPDEYAHLVLELRKSGIIKDQGVGCFKKKRCFTGRDFVAWVTKAKQLDEGIAMEMGQALIDKHFGHQIKNDEEFKADDTFYRLIEDDDTTALNSGEVSMCEPMQASTLGENLRRLALVMYSDNLSVNGKSVNYDGIASSDEYKDYLTLTKELVRSPVHDMTSDERKAFFINVYNSLVIHANIVLGKPSSLWQRYKFFNTARYVISGHAYSLQDIENGILRGNRPGVGQFFRPFHNSDPRLGLVLENDPRIHFALNCGAKSCPPIKTYSANGISSSLDLAAEAFLEGEDAVAVKPESNEVHLSMLFKWYGEDFGHHNLKILNYISTLMKPGEKQEQLNNLIKSRHLRVKYIPYDWSSNAK